MFTLASILSIALIAILGSTDAFAKMRYGSKLCSTESSQYYCYKVKGGDTWSSLFPNFRERDVVMRLNRVNIRLRTGMILAIPRNLAQTNILDIAPLPRQKRGTGERHMIVDLPKLAWGAYDENGRLLHWGPVSGGKGYCPDIGKVCRTVSGNFEIKQKQYDRCTSNTFPISSNGGSAMPFCMHFYQGYALHGSYEVQGYHASHGCVRMFINDARWLNENFIDIGTKVTIKKYDPYL